MRLLRPQIRSVCRYEFRGLNFPSILLFILLQAGKLFDVSGETAGGSLQIPQRVSWKRNTVTHYCVIC